VELSGKGALVTGSSRGIGREIARYLAKKAAGGGPLPHGRAGGPGDTRLP
jgi:NAD(P)-dependent dehydrogenase (short-subunit alcohol dehydrogenase family)